MHANVIKQINAIFSIQYESDIHLTNISDHDIIETRHDCVIAMTRTLPAYDLCWPLTFIKVIIIIFNLFSYSPSQCW